MQAHRQSRSIALPDNTQHSQETDIQADGGIRTRNPSKRAAEVQRLRRRGHRKNAKLNYGKWSGKFQFYTFILKTRGAIIFIYLYIVNDNW